VRVLDPLPSVAAKVAEARRKKPDELVPIIEDLIKLLDDVSNSLRRGRHPDRGESRKVAAVLRAVAGDLEA
jgi:CspA family cold shock protein